MRARGGVRAQTQAEERVVRAQNQARRVVQAGAPGGALSQRGLRK
jgi:hypothetical protein